LWGKYPRKFPRNFPWKKYTKVGHRWSDFVSFELFVTRQICPLMSRLGANFAEFLIFSNSKKFFFTFFTIWTPFGLF
jgi:hypothetical protein